MLAHQGHPCIHSTEPAIMYVDMACIVRTDDISTRRSKRVNEKIILCYTVQDKDQFPCKSSWFTRIISYDRHGLHYNVLSGPIISYFIRSKRVNEQIICLCTNSEETKNFRFIGASFAFQKEEEHGLFEKIMFHHFQNINYCTTTQYGTVYIGMAMGGSAL